MVRWFGSTRVRNAVRLKLLKSLIRRDRFWLTMMLAPYAVGMALLIWFPLVSGFVLAFTDFNAIQRPDFIGFSNFLELTRDRVFRAALGNSLFFMALATPLRLLGALALAVLLAAPSRGLGILRAIIYLPSVVPDLAWAIIWLGVLNPIYGPINHLLAAVGVRGPAWMVTESGARYGIVLALVWQIGEGFVVCLAALRDVPAELTEQAAVDGAPAWRMLIGIVLPNIAPVLLLLLLRDSIAGLQASFIAASILGRNGGPHFATTYLPSYIYTTAFSYLRFGYSAAMTLVLYALTAVVVAAQYRIAQRLRLGFRDVE